MSLGRTGHILSLGCLKLNSCACCNKGKGPGGPNSHSKEDFPYSGRVEAQKEVREAMLFLRGHGISSAYPTHIYKVYEQDAICRVLRLQDVLGRRLPIPVPRHAPVCSTGKRPAARRRIRIGGLGQTQWR